VEKILLQIATELAVRPAQVTAAVNLLDEGSTVPFIARYRKEATDGLDDTQLRQLEERLTYLRELETRREAVLKSIESQGQLTAALRAAIEAAPTKQDLEDLYLPYKPKRRTKAMIAREAGLEPLADRLFVDPTLDPHDQAAGFVNADAGFGDAAAVLDGVRDILSERWAEDAGLVGGCGKPACSARGWSTARTSSIPTWRGFATTSSTTNPFTACRRTVRSRCFVAARWKSWTPGWSWKSRPANRRSPRGVSHSTLAGGICSAPRTT
jgi:hypothetical protein